MATNHEFDVHQEEPRNKDVAFEKSDLGVRGILMFFVILIIAGVVFQLAVWGMYEGFIKISNRMQPPVSPMAVVHKPEAPSPLQNTRVNISQFPAPRLQVDEPGDTTTYRDDEDKILYEKPWEDKSGVVHIPVAMAMKILAQRGLPSLPGIDEPDYKNPMVVPTDSGFLGMNAVQEVDDATAVNQAATPGVNAAPDNQTGNKQEGSKPAAPEGLKKK